MGDPEKVKPRKHQETPPFKKRLLDAVGFCVTAYHDPKAAWEILRKNVFNKNGGLALLFIAVGIFANTYFLKSQDRTSTRSYKLETTNSSDSPVMQGVNIAATGITDSILIQGNQNSPVNIGNPKSFFQTNSGPIQGQINASSLEHIQVNQYFYNGNVSNPPDPELIKLRGRVSEVENKIETETTNLQLTRSDLLALTTLLKKIDERTEDIHRLPDGRTSLGGVIAIGENRLGDEFQTAIGDFNRGNFQAAFDQCRKIIESLEAAPSAWVYEIVYIKPEWKGLVYNFAALSAQRLASNNIANEFAQKAVGIDATPQNRLNLTTTLHNLAREYFLRSDFEKAFELEHALLRIIRPLLIL
jgi:tetratricopeptide (TPR) repeat protein